MPPPSFQQTVQSPLQTDNGGTVSGVDRDDGEKPGSGSRGSSATKRFRSNSLTEEEKFASDWEQTPPRPRSKDTTNPTDVQSSPLRPRTEGVLPPQNNLRAALVHDFPSSSSNSDSDGELEVEVPGALDKPFPLLNMFPESGSTPPSAQVIPCSNTVVSPVKRPPSKRRRLMERINWELEKAVSPVPATLVEATKPSQDPELSNSVRSSPVAAPSAVATPSAVVASSAVIASSLVITSSVVAGTVQEHPVHRSTSTSVERESSLQDSKIAEAPMSVLCPGPQEGEPQTVPEVLPPEPTPQSYYEAYTSAYPNYKGSTNDFLRACYYVRLCYTNGFLPTFLFDDLIRCFFEEYTPYVQSFDNNAKPTTAIDWYNRNVDVLQYDKSVVTKHNLEDIISTHWDIISVLCGPFNPVLPPQSGEEPDASTPPPHQEELDDAMACDVEHDGTPTVEEPEQIVAETLREVPSSTPDGHDPVVEGALYDGQGLQMPTPEEPPLTASNGTGEGADWDYLEETSTRQTPSFPQQQTPAEPQQPIPKVNVVAEPSPSLDEEVRDPGTHPPRASPVSSTQRRRKNESAEERSRKFKQFLRKRYGGSNPPSRASSTSGK